MANDVTVVVPTIPPRKDKLVEALRSITEQTHLASMVVIVNDINGEGAPATRTRGLQQVGTEWTAFLDDDDEFLPNHLQRLMEMADESGADLIFPWFHVRGGSDPFPKHFGRQFNIDDPHQTTITFLVRTDLALAAGGFLDPGEGFDSGGNRAGEDFRFVCRFAELGGKIIHLPERTWIWNHHPGNLSGRSWRA